MIKGALSLEALFKVPQALPAVPEVAARLIATFNEEDVHIEAVAAQIDHDPVLAAKVLQRANSAFFRLLRPVATVRQAINVLGLNKVRALVISTALSDSFHSVGGVNLDQYWNHSLATAVLARYISGSLSIDENLAFTAGLLHGIGELVLHTGMPEAMQAVDRVTPLLELGHAATQMTMIGFSYAEAGAELARRWRFPNRLVDALAQQNQPLEAELPEPLAAVIHLAAWRARLFATPGEPERLIHSYPDAVGFAIGIDPDMLVVEDVPPLADMPPL